MNRLTRIASTAVLLAVFFGMTSAQTAGDYRTYQTGDWNDVNTWEKYNGTTWDFPAPETPDSNSTGMTTILNGHNVTVTATVGVQNVTVNSGGTVTVAGSPVVLYIALAGMTVNGTLAVTGNTITAAPYSVTNTTGTLVIGGGGVLQYSQTHGTAGQKGALPIAMWATGSTCIITSAGNAGATSFNSGGAQNFYNLTWNCAAQTGNFGFGFSNNTIAGDVNIVNTNTGRFYFFGGSSGTLRRNGDFAFQAGQFATHGTGSQTFDTVYFNGKIKVTGGNFSLSRGSQSSGTGRTIWYVAGDSMIVDGAGLITMQNSNYGLGSTKIYFSKKGSQVVKLNNVSLTGYTAASSGSGFPFEVLDSSTTKIILSNITYTGSSASIVGQIDSGGTLDVDTSKIGGTGDFMLADGGSIISAHEKGLDSSFSTTGAKSLSKKANYAFTGSVAQVPGVSLPDSLNTLWVSNPAGLTLSDTFYCNTLNVASGALLRIDTVGILTADTGAVGGTIWNADSIASLKGFVFANGAVYEHARNGGRIPIGIWEQGSLCKVTGFTTATSIAGGGDQDFYNFEWNCPNQTGNASLGIYTRAIHGNVTLASSGSGRFYFMGGSSGTITLHGNFIQQAGNFGMNGTGSQTFDTVNCYGNVTATGGNWSVTRGSQSSGTGTSVWNMFGDVFTLSGVTTQSSNSIGGKLVFAKAGTQKLVLNNVTYGGGGLVTEVLTGSMLDIDTSIYGGTGKFRLNSGALLQSKHANGLNGNFPVNDTLTIFSKAANFIFSGRTAQVTGMKLPDTLNNLTINNSLGVALSKSTVINGVIALQNGVFNNTIPFALGTSGSISYEGGSLLLPAVVNVVSIKEARKDINGDLIPDHSVTGDTIKVYGVITSPNYQTTNTSYYIQDDSAGINVFAGGTVMNFNIGDSVFVIGTVLQFNGLTEISPLAANATFFGVLKQDAVIPAPKQLTLAQFLANPEMYESQLIRVDTLYKSTGSWPAAGSSASIYLKKMSGTDSLQLRIDSDTDIDGSPEPQYPINVVGIGSQFSSSATVYNNGYQILPRDTSDIWHIIVTGVEENLANVPIEYKLYQNYPNPFNPTTTIKFTVAKAGMARVKIYNAIGQEVATIFNQIAEPGKYYTVQLNAGGLSSGMYFSVFDSEGHREIKKMLMLK